MAGKTVLLLLILGNWQGFAEIQNGEKEISVTPIPAKTEENSATESPLKVTELISTPGNLPPNPVSSVQEPDHFDSIETHHSHHESGSFEVPSFLKSYNLSPLVRLCEEAGVEVSSYVSTAILSSAALLIFAVLGTLNWLTAVSGATFKTLIAFAAGSLLGDVFLHIIPEAEHSNEFYLLIISGIFLFFLLDKIMSPHKHHSDDSDEDQEVESSGRHKKSGKGNAKSQKHNRKTKDKVRISQKSAEPGQTVFLYLVADAMHNFLDGMAVAVAFRAKTLMGITTSFAIFFHEIPHELADFVVLLKSGKTLFRCLLLQFLTGIAAMIGTWVTFMDFSKDTLDYYAVPLIIGNFLYLAMTGMLGELKESGTGSALGESVGFLVGAGLMYAVTLID